MSLSSNFPTSKPSLNLDFANVGALDPRITFTRSSSATYTNSLGLITTAATNVARFDYDPVTLAARGLLVEEQRTNLLTYSEDISNADWTTPAITVSANFGTSPDGTVNADKMVGKSSYSGSSWLLQAESLSASTIYTASVFLKRSGVRYAYVGTDNSANRCVFFDLQTGTVGNAATGYSGSIVAVGNDWYRCVVTINTSTASYAQQMLIGQTDTANSVTYTGNNVDGILVWGAQLENNPFASSYIPTVASTVTRSADVASVNTLSPWFNATEGTLFVEATMPPSNNSRLAQIGVAGFSFLTQISFESRTSGGTDIRFTTYNDPVYISLYSPTLSVGQIFKGAGAYKNSDIAASFNGNTAVTSSTANSVYSPMTILGIGQGDSGSYANAHIRRLAYYPRRLTNAELQALTA